MRSAGWFFRLLAAGQQKRTTFELLLLTKRVSARVVAVGSPQSCILGWSSACPCPRIGEEGGFSIQPRGGQGGRRGLEIRTTQAVVLEARVAGGLGNVDARPADVHDARGLPGLLTGYELILARPRLVLNLSSHVLVMAAGAYVLYIRRAVAVRT